MKINLQEPEIHKALIEFISNQGIDTTNKIVTVQLTAGRKAKGHSAQIEITSGVQEVPSDNGQVTKEKPAIVPEFNFKDDDNE